MYHGYEDLRGIIQANAAQLLPNMTPIEYTSNTILPILKDNKSITSKYYYVRYPPQDTQTCFSSRPEHSSTAVDACSPLNLTQQTGYLYEPLWQYLVSFEDVFP